MCRTRMRAIIQMMKQVEEVVVRIMEEMIKMERMMRVMTKTMWVMLMTIEFYWGLLMKGELELNES